MNRLIAGAIILILACGASAVDKPRGAYISLGIGSYQFDDKVLNVESGFRNEVGFGYQVNNQWALESYIGGIGADFENVNDDLEVSFLNLNVLYYFPKDNLKTDFFALAGFERQRRKSNFMGTNKDNLFSFGLGLRRQFSDKVALKGLVKGYDPFGKGFFDYSYSLALDVAFGKVKKATPVVTQQPQPVQTAQPPERKDSDGDGVYDDQDRCPNTRPGAKVDRWGCEITAEKTVVVYFKFDEDDASTVDQRKLQGIAQKLRAFPDAIVTIAGHTDSKGSESYNMELSKRRAESVAKLLAERFRVSKDRMKIEWHGKSKPAASNDTEAGRAKNRRAVTVTTENK